MKNFRTLILAIALYKMICELKVPAHLKDQLLRSASSVALNLGEGRGKRTLKDQKKYFDIAFGSLRETQVALQLVSAPDEVISLADKTAAHLFCLLRSIKI